jgi:MFS family permease
MQVASSPEQNPSRLSGGDIRISMSCVILGWMFGSAFVQLSSGAVYASFARQLGVSESTFGFLAGVSPLMGFLQIPAARLLEGRIQPRTMMLWAGLISRSLWVLGAALPILNYFLPDIVKREFLLPGFIVCILLASIGQAFLSPAFFSWMSTLIPDRIGPIFWARRQQVGTMAGICVVLLGGYIADQAGMIKESTDGEFTPLLLYSVILTFAAICGVLDIASFFRVKQSPALQAPKASLPPFLDSLKEPLRDRSVRNYLAFTVMGVLGFSTTGPLLWLYCLEFLNWEKTLTGFVITVCPLVGIMISSRMWGNIAKNYGTKPMLRFSSLLMVFVPVFWLFALPQSGVPLMVGIFFSGILAAAYEISNMNFITRTAPHLPRPTLTALFSICAGVTFALGSWVSGIVAELTSGFHIELYGMHFVNFHIVLAFSLLPRLINAFYLAPRLEEPDSAGTRETVNEVGATLAQAYGTKFTRFFEAREE